MSNEPELLAELRRHNLLRSLLQKQIEADAVADEEVSSQEVEVARAEFLANNGLKDAATLDEFLKQNGWNEEDLNWQITLPLKIKSHCHNHYRHKAEAHFLTRKSQLDRVVYSLLRCKDAFLAQELYLRINEGEANFGDMASEFSEGPESNTKGIIGPVPMTQAHPALAEKLRTAKPGVLNPPMQLGEIWLIIRLESYTPAFFDEEMANHLSRELFNQWVIEETRRKMMSY